MRDVEVTRDFFRNAMERLWESGKTLILSIIV